jgi:hypothetical protein
VAKDISQPAQDPPVVGLQDQFTQGQYDPAKAKAFCAPAQKNQELCQVPGQPPAPLCDAQTHLKIYPIKRVSPGKDQLPPHGVQIDNQFGQQVLKVVKPVSLMVPTAKGLAAPPPVPPNPAAFSYEHYKCYKVTGGKNLKQVVQLNDQFGTRMTVVGKAMELCTPATKFHNGAIDPIRNPDRHLVCYTIKPKVKPPLVYALNQFGLEHLKLGPDKRLCVPSLKQVLP